MALDLNQNRPLGQGYFGAVFKGTLDSRPIAAKRDLVLNGVTSVCEEYRFLGDCNHENVIKCHGLFAFEGEFYLIMDLAEGGALEENLGRNLFATHAKRLLIQQICCGLDYIHGRNIVHRDIRAANLLIKNIAKPHLVISDFGAAQSFEESHSRPSDHDIVKDTVYSFKSDVYLTALVAFQIFRDERHVRRETLAGDILTEGLDEDIFTDGRWRQAILDALNQNPGMRPTALEFHNAFNQ